ncbi:MAG: CopG family transcriptional regulator [Chlamydiae bacterium]|nr:CopG family transcriptional regulator [Chlamydiota bacterium]MBI3277946.1 CopG family transcriptional regulator [Chlamydiota bacterium]
MMTRTQIYLNKDQMQKLKFEAQKEHLSLSELIRRAMTDFLKKRSQKVSWKSDPLVKAIGTLTLSVNNASTAHDSYLYDKKVTD